MKTEEEVRARIEEILTRINDRRTQKAAIPLLYSQVAILHWVIGEPFELVLA